MITIDKYGQSVKIYDGEVNMFFDREPMLRGCYIIKATGIVYILNYIFGHYEDFVINGVSITTIEEFTTQYALAIPEVCGGGGGSETWQQTLDNGSTLNKSNTINAAGFDFKIENPTPEFTVTTFYLQQDLIQLETPSSGGMLADEVTKEVTFQSGVDGTQTVVSLTPTEAKLNRGGVGYEFIPLSVDGNFANNVGNIALSEEIDVFLIDGQSNAQGHGTAASSPVPLTGTVLQYYLGAITDAVDPVGDAITGSAWPSFGVRYYNTTGRKICFVPASESGSSMCPGGQATDLRWDTGGTLYARSVTRMTNAMAALTTAGYIPKIKGILWIQGERDAKDINLGNVGTTATTYKSDFTTMLANYRTAFLDAHLPFYIFKTGTDTGESDIGYAAIRNAQEELAVTLTDTYIVYRNAIDFSFRGLLVDTVHWNQTGLNEAGRIGAEAVLNRYTYPLVFDKRTNTYAETLTWNGTPPSGSTNHSYGWQKTGRRCRLWVNLLYATPGTTNTNVQMPFPSDVPATIFPSGFGAVGQKCGIGFGWMDTGLTNAAPATRVQFNKDGSGNRFISITVASQSALAVMAEVEFDCAL